MKKKKLYKEECIFCKFAKGEIKPAIIYENKYVLAFLDINPCGTLEGHTLVLPKCHRETIEQIDEKNLTEAIKAVKLLVPSIKAISGAEGINILQNNGKAAGQYVNHVHFHLIPRKEGDGIYFEEKRRKSTPEELKRVAQKITKELRKTKK